jgi:hypothetical protein
VRRRRDWGICWGLLRGLLGRRGRGGRGMEVQATGEMDMFG